MLAEQFAQIFREEHRVVRDALLNLMKAFQAKDRERARSLLQEAASFVGPHFRYEEEALYPALVEIFGEEYIEELFGAHDKAIGGAKRLVEIAGQDSLGDEDVAEAIRIIRRTLPHVSDCEGLSIMVELMPEKKVEAIFVARERARNENLNLLQWAETVRGRMAAAL